MKDLDAEALYQTLAEQIRPQVSPATALVGIYTGGLWLAERLHRELGIAQPLGAIDVSFYRDDYASKGLHAKPQKTDIPFNVDGAHVILVDDVLFTGRTTRAAVNELFDFGRPAMVELAVLVDRGSRELPVAARYCAHTLPTPLAREQNLDLRRDEDGVFSLQLTQANR
ncbi:bifunctional pyr operon transcriptional regulator/uracil phosphoribosyltransferase PyrR [Thauera mechernichensis]|uniref:Bifunctional pyr operon transcriptional regulator/uracil phosphoribosyltransferase PyrR n=1 Tax=Thauera mechernichensis TaxID=82788 RepID=A0ABW3WAL0_9RHOO|nr:MULTISPECIES: bifunctional pyr operon transcriptional regulator/uracil phosphoribosyltransferase PyrR [Thauera]ENO80701.1 bifunctional pyrimidine regulatory protein PyrR uracil phosphoribosyltransferase [Thauera sp. 27]ENO92054.1 bifunctional pyrimidine regulatory protein PyrR uracil phosphoribosyltransferase [Thauera sp. 28]MDG3065801.1 bifunctional pyr operon transcriptional regulator/uracil phosphoribosyltransferase PyrR [Thauera mechernichensis]WBL64887.1 bifunctional pyr operon transcri